MSCDEQVDILTRLECVGSTLVYQDEAGEIHIFDLQDKIEFPETVTVLSFDPASKTLTYLDELGIETELDLSSLCSTFDYDPSSHSVIHNGVAHQLNCGALDFDPLTCALSYLDEKGVIKSWFIPQDRFVYDANTCTLTILTAKGDNFVVPVGVPQSEVSLSLTPDCDGCSLRFQYKDKICDVALPNMIVGCEYDLATNTIRMLHCDGSDKPIALPKASLGCTTLPDGTQVLNFSNGCPGGNKTFNIPGVVLDTDSLTLMGSTLTFTYGGDGNDDVVVVDICDIVATNCNAVITNVTVDGFNFTDNAGDTIYVPFPSQCCTYHGTNPTVLVNNAPPGSPAGSYPNKQDGDTLVECHPNGLSYWTCIDGNWSSDFTKVFTDCCHYQVVSTTLIDPANPPSLPPNDPVLANKADRDTAVVCHPNGWCAYTCVSGAWVQDWCKIDPEIPEPEPEVHVGTNAPDKDSGILVWFNCNDGCVYYCQEDGSWIAPVYCKAA